MNEKRSSRAEHVFKTVFLGIISLFVLSNVQAQDVENQLKKAHALVQNGEDDQALTLYNEILSANRENIKALAYSAQIINRQGQFESNKKEAMQSYQKAESIASEALQIDSSFEEANYAKALSLLNIALLKKKTKEKTEYLNRSKRMIDRLYQLDSAYAPGWYLRGRWILAYHEMGFTSKGMTKIFFGGLPKATLNDAINYFLWSKKLDPSFILTYYYLGQAYHLNGQDLKAIDAYKRAVALRPIYYGDRKIQKKVKEKWDTLL